MKELLKIANSPGAWVACSLAVLAVLLMAVFYIRLCYKNAHNTKLTKSDCNKALRSGIISSIGPAIAIFVVVLSLSALIGSPMAWMRLAIIGGAATEMAAAQISSEAIGAAIGSSGYTLDSMAIVWFAMGANGCGWLLFVFLFGHKMEKLRQKMGGGDPVWLGLIAITATIGLFSYLAAPYVLAFDATSVTTIVAAITMALLTILGKKKAWLKEYALTFALIIGAAVGTVTATIFA